MSAVIENALSENTCDTRLACVLFVCEFNKQVLQVHKVINVLCEYVRCDTDDRIFIDEES